VRAVLGQGAFGTVYRAYDPKLDREVALKVPRFPPNRPELVERFLREARAAARLRHPGIVAVFEAGTASGQQFIASELVTGSTLRERMDSGGLPAVRQAVAWVRDLALALEYAHGQGVIHRDIKPANIMIDSQNRAQLMDFGLAKRVDLTSPVPLVGDGTPPDATLGRAAGEPLVTADTAVLGAGPARSGTNAATDLVTADGRVVGTPAYMSPEQAGGAAHAVGRPSDQYSLGVLLYELLTGHLPFEGGSVQELLRQVTDPARPARSPCALNPEVPAPLAAVCLKALAKQPARRYGSAADLAVELQRWLKGQRVHAYRRPRRRFKKARELASWWRGHTKLMLVALLCLALVGVVIGVRSWLVASGRREGAAAEAARRLAEAARCDQYRERGRARDGRGLRYLAESLAVALELQDGLRQQAAIQLLTEGDRPLPRPPGTEGKARLRWDLAAGLLLGRQLPEGGSWEKLGERLAHAGSGQLTGFGAGGKCVLTADGGKFRDARTGQPFAMALRPDQQFFFLPGGRHGLCIGPTWTVLDLDSGKSLGPKHERDWRLRQWGFSPDGTKLVIGWPDRRFAARPGSEFVLAQIWDVTSVKPLTVPIRPADSMSGVSVSNDGSRMAMRTHEAVSVRTISDEDRMRQGDLAQGAIGPHAYNPWQGGQEESVSIRPSEGGILAAAFHPDNQHLLIAGWNRVELWEASGKLVGELLPARGVQELVVSPHAEQVLTRGADGWQLWDMQNRHRVGLPLQRLANVKRVDFRADGRQLLTAADGDARLWPNPVVAANDRAAAVRLWAQAVTGFDVDAAGDLQALDPGQVEKCRQGFGQLAGLAP
jgi:hypothetical protein